MKSNIDKIIKESIYTILSEVKHSSYDNRIYKGDKFISNDEDEMIANRLELFLKNKYDYLIPNVNIKLPSQENGYGNTHSIFIIITFAHFSNVSFNEMSNIMKMIQGICGYDSNCVINIKSSNFEIEIIRPQFPKVGNRNVPKKMNVPISHSEL